MKTLRRTLLQSTLHTIVVTFSIGTAFAQNSISLNFTDSAGAAVTAGSAGAIPVPAANWTNLGGATGASIALKDQSGAATSAAVNWSAKNTWRSGGTTTTGNGQLTKGYLDDGQGNVISISNIPYLSYNAYVVMATDQGGGTQGNANYTPVSVNGVNYSYNGTATVPVAANWIGRNWSDAATLVEGQNYLKVTNLGGLTAAIRGVNGGAARGTIAGIQIQDTYAGSYAYWDLNGSTAGAGSAAPAGTWSGSATNWSTSPEGTAATTGWAGAGHTAVFSSGSGATGNFTVTVAGTQTTDAVIVRQGNVTLSGGAVSLASPGVVRALSGTSLQIGSTLSGTSGIVLEGSGPISLSGTHPISGPAVVSAPTVTLSSGTSFPSLGSLEIANNSTLSGSAYSIVTSASVNAGDGAHLNSAGATLAIGGNINLVGGSLTATGNSTLAARNLSLNVSNASPSLDLSGTTVLTLSSTAPVLSTLQIDSGALTLGGAAIINTDRFTNRGAGNSPLVSISGTAQLNITQELTLGNNQSSPISVIQSGGSVTNTGTSNSITGNVISNRWGNWPNAHVNYAISSGSLNLMGAPLYLSWDSGATLVISGDSQVNLYGVEMGYGGRTQTSSIGLDGGRLNVGPGGITSATADNKLVLLGAGTLGASASWRSNVPMMIVGSHPIDTGNFDITLAGDISGDGQITKIGSGTLSLTGSDSFGGPTNINAGMLRVGGSLDGEINIASGASVGAGDVTATGFGSVTSLNLANGSSSTFRIGENSDSLSVYATGGLKTTTAHTINIVGAAGLNPGTYTLYDYEGSISGTGYSAFTLGNKPHIIASLQNNTVSKRVDLVVVSVDQLIWTGASGSAWNVNADQNWKLSSNSSTAAYFQTDTVRFNDSAVSGTVVASGVITPAETTFANSTLAYTISGTGIGGSGALLKTGVAKVTLLNPNTYTGITQVSEGVLQVGNSTSGSLSPNSMVMIESGAEFILAPSLDGTFANAVNIEGIFRLTGSASTTLGDASSGGWAGGGEIIIDSTGPTVFGATKGGWYGNLTINAGSVRATTTGNSSLGLGTSGRTITVNGASTTLTLAQSNIFGNGASSADNVPVVVLNRSTLNSTSYNVLGNITMNGAKISGGSVDPSALFRGFELRGTITVTGTASSLIETTTGHENHLDVATTFVVGDVTSSPAADLSVTAPFRNASPDHGSVIGGMVKQGVGTMDLTAVSIYTGVTDVQEGNLRVSGALGNTVVNVASGATLSGGGSVGGKVTVLAGGTLSPGTEVGTMTASASVLIAGNLRMELNGAAADRLNVTGELDITNATLNLTALGAGANQPVYIIAQYGTLVGTSFANIQNLPPGYTISYNHGAGLNQIALVGSGSDPFATWVAGFGLSGNDALAKADPDEDGIPNAIEFIIGGNPSTGSDAAKLPKITISGGSLEFTFRRSAASNAAPFPTVEFGGNLIGWATAQSGQNGVTISVTDLVDEPGFDRVVVRIPVGIAGSKLFARLNANR